MSIQKISAKKNCLFEKINQFEKSSANQENKRRQIIKITDKKDYIATEFTEI